MKHRAWKSVLALTILPLMVSVFGYSATIHAQAGGGSSQAPARPMTDEQADRYINDFVEECKADPLQCRSLSPQMREYLASPRLEDCGTNEQRCRAQRDRAQAALNEHQASCRLNSHRCDPDLGRALSKRHERTQEKWCASRAGGCGK